MRFAAIRCCLGARKFGDTVPWYYTCWKAGWRRGRAHELHRPEHVGDRSSIRLPADAVASPNNFYRGDLGMSGNEPTVLTIESFTADPRKDASAKPYITISATFVRVSRFRTSGWMPRRLALSRSGLSGLRLSRNPQVSASMIRRCCRACSPRRPQP